MPNSVTTFDDIYPLVPVFFEPHGLDVIKCKTAGPCWHCGRETQWVEFNFEAHLCSPECVDAKWNEFIEANRRLGPPGPPDPELF